MNEVGVRPAAERDRWWVYEIAMDETTRAMSTRSDRFTREQHSAWYDRRLADSDQLFLIGVIGGAEIGYVRFGRATEKELAAVGSSRPPDRASAEVAIALAPRDRGKGYAAPLLLAGEAALRARWPDVHRLFALILPGNDASAAAFGRAGYDRLGMEIRLGKRHELFAKNL